MEQVPVWLIVTSVNNSLPNLIVGETRRLYQMMTLYRSGELNPVEDAARTRYKMCLFSYQHLEDFADSREALIHMRHVTLRPMLEDAIRIIRWSSAECVSSSAHAISF